MTAETLRYSVSGPGVDKTYADPGAAISAALTFADHHVGDASFYVRDLHGGRVARIDHDEHGNTTVWKGTVR